ncbi:MAG: transporter substrate-binding domain-containing protein [Candidatus Competibacter sp.]|nr:transporter substrate-binding domain-containing protein [Candidatus Competibacter sp.]
MEQIKKDGLRVCMDPEVGAIPFVMTDKKGELIGHDVDTAHLMAKELNTQLHIVKVSWEKIIPALMDNQCDIILNSLSITDERKKLIDYSTVYAALGQTVIIRKDLATKLNAATDLNHSKYKLTSVKGTNCEKMVKQFMPEAQYSSFKTMQEAVNEVAEGKADGFVFDSISNKITLKKLGQDKLALLDSPFTFENLGIGVRKGNAELLNWINDFLAKIRGNGVKNQLYQKWLRNIDWLDNVR